MIKAIFFDIDDTLFSTTRFADRARRSSIDAMVKMGLKIDPEEGYRELKEVIEEFSSNYGAHYDKFLSRQSREALEGTNPTLLAAAAVVAYHEMKIRELSAYEDVLQSMRLLSTTPLILGIITSGLRIKQAEKLVRLKIWRYIDPRAIFITDEVGIGKPNPKLYQRACEQIGVAPSEVMYVGDSPGHDVVPPQSLGMRTVWARRASKWTLEGTGIEPDHVIDDFDGLLALLRDEYGVPV